MSSLELRVLIGLHREARCAVHDGATVGSDTACDIVLSDDGIAPNAGRIRLDQHGWTLISDDDDVPDESTLAAWNEARSLGRAWITVAPNDAPWITPNIGDIGDNTADAATPGDTATATHSTAESSSASDASSAALIGASHSLTDEKNTWFAWPTLLVIGAVTLLILSAIGLYALSTGSFSSKSSTKKTSAEQSLGQISATLERLGLASSVHATLSKAGTVTLSGWVRDKAQYDALASAMSQIWPMPGMRISLESDAITTARSVLQQFSVKYDPSYQGAGRLNIVGVASSARERAAALDAVRAQLSGLTVIGNSIELAQQVSDKLAEKLKAQGLSGVTLTWQPGHLEVQPPSLDDAQETKLESVIDDFNKQYWGLAQVGNIPPTAVADSVPFVIRSVIGGPQPFIVLSDGTKLLIGGTYKKYTLTAVDSTQITFDGPRRAIVTR